MATGPIYPSAPLEMDISNSQRQQLLPPAPPTYAQATKDSKATTDSQPSTPAAHVIIVTPPGAQEPLQTFGPEPVDMECPYCHNFIRTRLKHQPNSRTHIIAILLCAFQLWCCVCLPYCIASCMNTNHYCGMCDNYLGSFTRS